MNILLIGQAVENTATAQLLRRSRRIVDNIYCHGGRAGSDAFSRLLPVRPQASVSQVVKAAFDLQIDLVVLTTEQAVLSGIANAFQSVRIPCFGPTTVAAHFRWDPGFVAQLAGDLRLRTVTRTCYRNLGALSEALQDHFANEGVTIRAVRSDGRAQIFHCASLTQIANAIYMLESQPDLHQYVRFYLETFASGSRCTYVAMVNGRNLISIGADSSIKTRITDQVARPLLKMLHEGGAAYTGWLVVDLVVGAKDLYLCDLQCLPRPEYLTSLTAGGGFDLLNTVMTVLASDTEPATRPTLLPDVSRPGVPPPVKIPLPLR
jgi:phosphoribosylamine-glycine ligase